MFHIIKLKETTSTNLYLQQLLKKEEVEEGTVIVVEEQTAGKGQGSNTWESEKGKNLTFSIVLYPDFIEIERHFFISEIVSLAVADTLSEETDDIYIKWPNDIYFREKKITGILIENTILGNVIQSSIIGVGTNINQQHFVSKAPNPVSLSQITGKEYELDSLLKSMLKNLYCRYKQLIDGEFEKIHQEYLAKLFRCNGFHTFKANDKCFEARIKEVTSSGYLLLETKDKKEYSFAFKEVQFVL